MRINDFAVDLDIVDISSTDFTVSPPCHGISFGTAGDLVLVLANGRTKTITSGALSTGAIHRISVKQVKKTGTTAANIVVYRNK